MKIILRDEQGIKRCFVQVRDVEYLVQKYNSPKLGKMALGNASYRDLRADEFFEVKNMGVAKIIDDIPYIVEFGEVVNYDALTLSRMIVLSQSLITSEKEKLDEENKVRDLQDVMSFNKGMLTYPIPVLYDELIIDDGEVVFGSSTIPGYYMLKSYDEDLDLGSYLETNASNLFHSINEDGEMASYEVTKLDNALLVHFKEKNKLLAKIRKRITG